MRAQSEDGSKSIIPKLRIKLTPDKLRQTWLEAMKALGGDESRNINGTALFLVYLCLMSYSMD